MRIEFHDDFEYTIFILKEYMQLTENPIKDLEKIFDKASELYDIDNYGYIKVNLYTDPNYGVILDCIANKEKYYSNKLNIELETKETKIMIKLLTPIKNSFKIDKNYYIIPKKITDYELGEITYKV